MSRNAELVSLIRSRAGDDPVRVGLILGTGLGGLAAGVEGVSIPYADLPGFPETGVIGHDPKLTIGQLEGVRVAVFGGRAHYYEGGNPSVMRTPLEVLKALGADTLIVTNAAGSVDPAMPTGAIMALTDHIAFSGLNPLIGEASVDRFVPMTDAYDPALRDRFHAAARAEGIELHAGVYAWFSGPSFETPAEIRAIRILGADAVGMSTAPEVILGRFLGLRVGAISNITNMAAGLSDESIGHDHTMEMAPIGAAKLEKVLRRTLRDLD